MSARDAAANEALLARAAAAGAEAALGRLGLTDAAAGEDLRELRQLLDAWRDAKRSARRAAVEWAVRAVLALLLIALAIKLGLAGLLK